MRLRDRLKPRESGWFLIAANAVPVIGVLLLGWDLFLLVLIYWIENGVIGLFNVMKMIASGARKGPGGCANLLLIPFFCVHYGGFWAGHGVFVIVLFGSGDRPFGNVDLDRSRIWDLVESNHLFIAIAALFISHGLSFVLNYIGRGEYRRTSLPQLMAAPYVRVFVLHIFIIFGAFIIMLIGAPKIAVLLLAVLKTGADLIAHNKSHRHQHR